MTSKCMILIFTLLGLTGCAIQSTRNHKHGSPDDPNCYYPKDDPRYQFYPCDNDQAELAESHHPNEVPLDHKFFVASYNPKHRLPNWVSYKLDLTHVSTKAGARRGKFFADPQLIARRLAYAKPTDFDGKNYERGPLAPSEDFAWSQAANDATYVMSNMVPQRDTLKRGSWKKLEAKVRKGRARKKN